jgi:hypothetical protein
MYRKYLGIVYPVLVASALFLLSASPAAAFCSHKPTVYNTGTLVGTGSTCTDAQNNLSGLLFNTAEANCQSLYGDDASVEFYVESLNSCEPNGVGKKQTGSAQYKCVVCVCVGLHCGSGPIPP